MKKLLKNRSFSFLWFGVAVSGLGDTFIIFVLSWLVYHLTGSYLAMGSLWFIYAVPQLVTQFWMAPYIDKWNKKFLMVISEWVRAAAYLGVAVLFMLDLLNIWHLYIAAFVAATVEVVFDPSSTSYLASILSKDQLMRGNSLIQGTAQLMMLIGPTIAGVVLQVWGADVILLFTVSAMLLSGILLLFMQSEKKSAGEQESFRWWAELKKGISFFKIQPVLFWIAMLIMFANFSFGAAQPLFWPYVKEILKGTETQFGIFQSMVSLGMLAGVVWINIKKEFKQIRFVMLAANLCVGIVLFGLGVVTIYYLALLLMVIFGIAIMIFNVQNTTIYQYVVPEELRGRVFMFRMLLAQSGAPLGAITGSIIAEIWGIQVLYMILGVLIIVTTITAFSLPVFKKLDTILQEEDEKEKSAV